VTGIQVERVRRVTSAQCVEVAVHQKLLYTCKLFIISVVYLSVTAKPLISSNNSDRNTSFIDRMKESYRSNKSLRSSGSDASFRLMANGGSVISSTHEKLLGTK